MTPLKKTAFPNVIKEKFKDLVLSMKFGNIKKQNNQNRSSTDSTMQLHTEK